MADLLYELVKFGVRCRFRKPKIYGEENVDLDTPAIFLSNHERFYGPAIITTRFTIPVRQWATSLIVELDEAKKYVQETLFMETLHMKKGISRLLGSIAARPISWAIRNSNPIPAYWDAKRSRESIQLGLDAIENGENQYIYAPHRNPNDKEFEFMQGFAVLAKYSQMRLNITPNLYPVAINRKKQSVAIGKPTVFSSEQPFKREIERVNQYICAMIKAGYNDPKHMTAQNMKL